MITNAINKKAKAEEAKETRRQLTKALFKLEKMKISAPYVNKDIYEDKQ